jgi:hypothetical protein
LGDLGQNRTHPINVAYLHRSIQQTGNRQVFAKIARFKRRRPELRLPVPVIVLTVDINCLVLPAVILAIDLFIAFETMRSNADKPCYRCLIDAGFDPAVAIPDLF